MNLLFPGSSPTKIKILSSNYHMFIICEYEQPEKKLPHSVEQIVLPTVAIKGHRVRGSVERGQISERRHCICLLEKQYTLQLPFSSLFFLFQRFLGISVEKSVFLFQQMLMGRYFRQ